MSRLPKIIPVKDLHQDAAAVLKQVAKSHGPFVITQRGKAAAVLLSAEAYQQAESERQILEILARGEKEIAEGYGYDLDSVLAETDALLEAEDS